MIFNLLHRFRGGPKTQPPAIRAEGNVRILRGVTTLDIPVERILAGATDADLATVVIVGVDAEGEFYFASNKADGGEVLWWLERAKLALLNVGGA